MTKEIKCTHNKDGSTDFENVEDAIEWLHQQLGID